MKYKRERNEYTHTHRYKDKSRKCEFECKHKEYGGCIFSRIFWDAGDDSPAIRRKPVARAKTSIASTTDRKVMKLQDYVKYLVCIFVVNFGTTFCNIIISSLHSIDDQIASRHERSVLDLLFGRFRTCGACLCGRPNRKATRLLGGEYTESHEFPWLANIHAKSKIISGVLINDRYVMTAASQVIGTTAPEIKISLGEYDRCTLDISSVNVSVESIILHPEFNPDSHTHDLALIRLSRPTKFEKRISPVCLPNPGSTYLGQVGTLSGWTISKSEDDIDAWTCRPRKLGLPILGYNECIKSGMNPTNFNDDYGCIGVVGTSSLVCENDIGSSVQYRSYSGVYDLIGIIPSVNKCDNVTRPTVFTKIGPRLDWILQHTKDACFCTK